MFEQDGRALNPVSHATNLYISVRSGRLLSKTSSQALFNSSIYRANTAAAYPFTLDALNTAVTKPKRPSLPVGLLQHQDNLDASTRDCVSRLSMSDQPITS